MARLEHDLLGQPGNCKDKVFGAQLREELRAYRELRDSGKSKGVFGSNGLHPNLSSREEVSTKLH